MTYVIWISLAASLLAVALAMVSMERGEQEELKRLKRRMANLEADSVADRDTIDRLFKSVHKLRTRAGTEDARKRKANEETHADQQFDPDEVMRKYPLGVFSMPGNRQE